MIGLFLNEPKFKSSVFHELSPVNFIWSLILRKACVSVRRKDSSKVYPVQVDRRVCMCP